MVLTLYRSKAGSGAYVPTPRIAPLTGRYYGVRSAYGGTATTAGLTANILSAAPFFVPAPMTVNRIEANITTAAAAGKLLRIGLYDADPATGLPRTLLADAGALAADPGAVPAIVGATIAATLVPGLPYWLTWVSDGTPTLTGTTPTIAPFGSLDSAEALRGTIFRAFTYAALPNPWGTHSGYGSGSVNVVVRAA